MIKLPTGVCRDKERGKYRATYKGHSIRCDSLEKAIAKRQRLVKAKVAHPSYIVRELLRHGKTVQIQDEDGVIRKAIIPLG